MRNYSLRSSYPLAQSSRSRRRLMLLHHLNSQPEVPEPEEPDVPIQAFPQGWDEEEVDENERTLTTDELRRLSPQQFPDVSGPEEEEDNFAEPAFADEMFAGAASRNAALETGESESVLDEDEAAEAEGAVWEESILSSSLGDESMILSGQEEESRILSMDDLEPRVKEELPGSSDDLEDRKPHYPAWYVPNFKTVKRVLDGDKPVTWMFAGESAASAADQAQGRRNFTDHFSDRIRTELGRMLDVVINTGDANESCANLLKNLEWRVLRFHPEVVCLLLGRNDARQGPAGREAFQTSLEQIAQAIREAGSILVLHTPNRIDPSRASHLADLRSYVRIIRDVAQSHNLPLIDHWEHWKQQKTDPQALRAWLSADGVQPGVYGQREMAKLIFQQFEIFDPASPICNARVP